MSKFQSTISVVAALASIFGAGAAGWKLAQESNVKPAVEVPMQYESHITDLQQKISELEQQSTTPVVTPPPQLPPVVQTPPPLPPLPEPQSGESE